MRFRYYLKSDKGGFRENNQDSAYARSIRTSKGHAFLGIVCDGMGGLSHGELASKTVADAFAEWFEQEFRYIMYDGDISQAVFVQWSQIVTSVNSELRRISGEMGCQMGTTLSVVLLFSGRYYSAQIGDSRVYLMSGEDICQITRDHSLVADMAQKGLMTENEINSSSNRNVLTRCLGVMESVSADYYSGEIVKNDSFLLCSDGLYSGLSCVQMAGLLGGAPFHKGNIRHRVDSAVNRRITGGEKDNITALMVRVVG